MSDAGEIGPTQAPQSGSSQDDLLFDQYLDQLLAGASPDPERYVAENPNANPSLLGRLQALESLISREAKGAAKGAAIDLCHADDLPCERLGGYRLVRRIGRGGMGSVFLAEQESLGRLVALKLIDPARSSSRKARERFLEEARLIAEISHPNIVRVIDFGEEHEIQFMAMELMSGRDLETLLLEGSPASIPLHRKLGWFLQIARALDHAHRQGIVHRDVKPANIQITIEDEAILLDFGLARATDRETRTLKGLFLGTVAYASPEQVEAKSGWVAPATDIYSLGASLYRVLGGKVPFDGETNEEVLRNILVKEPTPLGKLSPSLPKDVQTIVHAAMERDPSHRYASMSKFAEDLQAVLELRPISATPPSLVTRCMRWARRNPIRANAIVVFLGLVLAVFAFQAIQDWREGSRAEERIVSLWGDVEDALGAADQSAARIRELEHDAESLDALDRSQLQSLDLEGEGQQRSLNREEQKLREQAAPRREIEASIGRIRSRMKDIDRRKQSWQDSMRDERNTNASAKADAIAKLRGDLGVATRSLNEIQDLSHLKMRLQEVRLQEARARRLMIEWRVARALGRASQRSGIESRVRALDTEARFDLELRGKGRLELPPAPEGTEFHLFRYVWLSGGRQVVRPVRLGAVAPPGDWFPLPVDDQATELATRPPRMAQPTDASRLEKDFDRILDAGSYLLVVERAGLSGQRIPFALRPGAVCTPEIAAATRRGPEGFVLIAGGAFEYGGDRSAPGSEALQSLECEAFWMQEREVTWSEYAGFLNDPSTKGIAKKLGLSFAPRHPEKGELWAKFRREDGDYAIPAEKARLPVFAVSFEDAERYAAYRTRTAREAGKPFRFAIPTEVQWAKVANGADGRPYPWGGTHYFVNDFRYDREGSWHEVMQHPRDVSPHGVHDIGGGVGEWCSSRDSGAPIIRGATFLPGFPAHRSRRNAVRIGGLRKDQVDLDVGIRLIAQVDV